MSENQIDVVKKYLINKPASRANIIREGSDATGIVNPSNWSLPTIQQGDLTVPDNNNPLEIMYYGDLEAVRFRVHDALILTGLSWPDYPGTFTPVLLSLPMNMIDEFSSSSTSVSTSIEDLWSIISRQADRFYAKVQEFIESADMDDEDTQNALKDSISSMIFLLGEPAIAASAKMLESQDEQSAETMLQALANVSDESTLTTRERVIEAQAKSSSPYRRFAAVRALGKLNSSLSRRILQDLASGDNNIAVRQIASSYLK